MLSLITGFATMFIVTPYLAANQNYFGIYTFVISLNLFLSYADFGFLNAGVKFASEAFATGNRKEEAEILGFVTFILSVFFVLFGLVVLVFYFFPHSILSGLDTSDTIKMIKELFLVFIICLPILVAHRIIQLIFNIRLQDYKYQRIYSILNLVKIAFVFLFFKNGEYHIVGYYAFTQILTLVGVFIGVGIAISDYSYDFLSFLKLIKFNKKVYNKTKNLAFNSLFVTISWIIYYELDSLVIGKFVGLKEVAIFNICISVMTLARSLYGIIYNPFVAKFNHYIGRGQLNALNVTFYKLLVFGIPLSIIPTLVILITMNSFILSWVGVNYVSAIPIITVMFASYFFAFLSNPMGIAMFSLQKIKSLYFISAILPLIYWLGIAISFQFFGLFSFGLFKFIAFLISAIFYLYFSKIYLNINWLLLLKKNILAILISVFTIYIINSEFEGYLPSQKGMKEMVQYSIIIASYITIAMSVYYVFSKDFRIITKFILRQLFKSKIAV